MRRRDFAESLARAALVPLFGAEASGFRFDPAFLAGVAETRAPDAAAPDEPSALAKALAEAIRVQYGGRLGAGDLTTITRQIQASLERAEQLRRIELANSDEPAFVFSAVPPRTAE